MNTEAVFLDGAMDGMTLKRESQRQWFMSNYIYMFVLYKYRSIFITNGSLNFNLDSRLGVMAYRGNV